MIISGDPLIIIFKNGFGRKKFKAYNPNSKDVAEFVTNSYISGEE
jgi:hypothetical protein